MPLLFPTLGFIVGCVVAYEFAIDIWVPLIMVLIGGTLAIFRGWSGALIIMAMGVGGVRMSLHYNATQEINTSRFEKSGEQGENFFTLSNEWAEGQIAALGLSPRGSTLVSSMVLGNRESITYDQRERYGYSGASHILAVSGFHISVVMIFINLFLIPIVALPRGHIIRNILAVVLIWIYGSIVGLSPSVVRSVIMFSLLQLAWARGESYSGMNALLVAIIGGVVLSPDMLYSVGFQLSVLAVASIFLWGLPLYRNLFGGGGFIVSSLCICFGCSVATMPIVSHTWGYIPMLGILVGPLFILCSGVIITLGVAWIVLPLGLFSSVVRLFIEVASMIQERGVEWVASQEWGVIVWRATYFQLFVIYLIYIVITLLFWGVNNDNNDKKS